MTDDVLMTGVTLFKGEGSVLAKFEFAPDVKRPGSLLFGFYGYSADDEISRQFGLKFFGGDRIAYFVFDHNAAQQTNLGEIPTDDEHQVLAPFPSAPFEELGEGAKFFGYVTIGTTDVQRNVPVETVS